MILVADHDSKFSVARKVEHFTSPVALKRRIRVLMPLSDERPVADASRARTVPRAILSG